MDPGLVLRQARAQAGLSQRALAARAGVPQPTIARIEAGSQSPRVDTLDRLLQACGHDLRAVRVRAEDDNGVDRAQLQALLRLSAAERARRGSGGGRLLQRLAVAPRVGGPSR